MSAAETIRRVLSQEVEVPVEGETFTLRVPGEEALDELTNSLERMTDAEARGGAATRMAARAVLACIGVQAKGVEVADMVRFIAATGGYANCPLVAPAMRLCGMGSSEEADPAGNPT